MSAIECEFCHGVGGFVCCQICYENDEDCMCELDEQEYLDDQYDDRFEFDTCRECDGEGYYDDPEEPSDPVITEGSSA